MKVLYSFHQIFTISIAFILSFLHFYRNNNYKKFIFRYLVLIKFQRKIATVIIITSMMKENVDYNGLDSLIFFRSGWGPRFMHYDIFCVDTDNKILFYFILYTH